MEFVSFDLIGRRLPFCFFLCVSLAFVIHIMCAHEYNKYVVDLDWAQVDLDMDFQLGTICATSYYKMFISYSDCDQCATYVICNTFNIQFLHWIHRYGEATGDEDSERILKYENMH